jgi:hypothetical protein
LKVGAELKQKQNSMSKKQNIIEGIGFVLMVLSIITLIGAMYQLREVNKAVKELRTIMHK